MRTQADRDEQTVAIGTALGVFALVMAGALLVAWLLDVVCGAMDAPSGPIVGRAMVALAAGLALASLVRSRRD